MSDQFWNILFWAVLATLGIILWFHHRWCKAKGIKPKPAFNRFKKHEKRISKLTDIFLIAVILLNVFVCGSTLFAINDTPQDMPHEYIQTNTRLSLSVSFLSLFMHFTMVAIMASLLSPFHQNITLKKRLILTAMCCVPLVFGTLYCIFDDNSSYSSHWKLLLMGLWPLVFFNGPAIIFGKSFVELVMPLSNKIRRWLRLPEWKENNSE